MSSHSLSNRSSIMTTRYSANHTVFSGPPSEPRDYSLGLLATDGCVLPERNLVSIHVQAGDRGLLEHLVSVLSSTGPITPRLCCGGATSDYKSFPTVGLAITSRQMVSDLERFGITARKSRSLRIKGVED